MATYKSTFYAQGARLRPTGQNNAHSLTVSVTIPAGVALAVGDVLKFGRLGEDVRVKSYNLNFDKFDSGATATLAGKLGITADDDCLLAAGKVQKDGTGAMTIARTDGEATANDSFPVTPFPVQNTVQEVMFTVTAAATTPAVAEPRNVTLELFYQRAYPETTLLVDGAGNKVRGPATVFDYGNP